MTTANQIGLGVILGILANALYWWVIQPAWNWLLDRVLPVDPPLFLGGQLATIHLHGIVAEDR